MPNGTWSGTPPTCVKGTFSTGGFWCLFLVFVQHKSHIMHLLLLFFVLVSLKHLLIQSKQTWSSVPLHPNCSMATMNLVLTRLEVLRQLSFSVKSPTF